MNLKYTSIKKPIIICFILLMLCVTILFPQSQNAYANTKDVDTYTRYEHIESFDSQIFVHKNGTIDVEETIEYDFGYYSRHGIFRYIPFEYNWDGEKPKSAIEGSKYLRETPLKINSITQDITNKAEFSVKEENQSKVIKIGNANRTIAGQHQYKISYTLKNFINSFGDIDELNININGNGWDIPISKLKVQIEIEGVDDVKQLETLCFVGYIGSTRKCDTQENAGGKFINFEQNNLVSTQNVTTLVAIPKGVLSPEKPIIKEEFTFKSAFRITPLTLGGFFLILFIGLGIVTMLVYKKGRDRRFVGSAIDAAMGNNSGEEYLKPLFNNESNPVEFIPPENIRPGQIGVLVDEKADDVDVTATLVDLAVRGYISISEEQISKKSIIGFSKNSTEYSLTKVKEFIQDENLNGYEKNLLSGLFSKNKTFKLSDMTNKQSKSILKAKDELYDNVVKNKWYRVRPDKTRSFWLTFSSIIFLVIGLPAVVLVAYFTHFGFSSLAIPISALALLVNYKKMPARTAKGTAMVGRIAGFRQIFDAGEGERQAFAEKSNLFLEYLPYAIVFGCAEKWAKVFEDLGFTQEQLGINKFYSGTNFTPLHLAYAMGSFSAATISTTASVHTAASRSFSSGSSGFSGGGFSGGGGGGGGGGSW